MRLSGKPQQRDRAGKLFELQPGAPGDVAPVVELVLYQLAEFLGRARARFGAEIAELGEDRRRFHHL